MITSYKIIFKKDALKFIEKNKKIGLLFYKAFIELSNNRELIKNYDIKKLQGFTDVFRMRISKYRAIFKIIDNELIILVINIDSRGDVYKN